MMMSQAEQLGSKDISKSFELGVERLKIKMGLNPVSLEELIVFTRQFHTLFKAGLSADALFQTLAKQSQNMSMQISLKQIQNDIHAGSSMAQAFAKQSHIFDKLYVSMLYAGEEAGILEDVLQELSHVLDKENEIKKEISSATLYPKIVVVAMILALVAMLTFIIPEFAKFYARYDAPLPLPTRIVLGSSEFMMSYWYIVLSIVVGATFIFKKFYATPAGKLKVDGLKLKAPIFGNLIKKIEMARFGHLFSALYKSGLPIVRILEILNGVMGNQVYSKEMRRLRAGVMQGKSLGELLRRSKHFPPLTIETTCIGEKAGNLDEMLLSQAKHFDLEVKHLNKNLTTMLEPILLGGVFGMVTVMVLAIFMPMWSLSNVVMHK
ncbi:MAG: type II secretion system F family protein [Deltaproteobacteria bacterium]|nr:type II secretion system F family protein [Deltaproteobacteria bacterium]